MWGVRTVLVVVGADDRRATYRDWLAERYRVRTARTADIARSLLTVAVDVVVVADRLLGDGGLSMTEIRDRTEQCTVVVVRDHEGANPVELGVDAVVQRPVNRGPFGAIVDRLATRTAYERGVEAYYELAKTKVEFEQAFDPAQLCSIEEYRALLDRLQQLGRSLDDITTTTDTDWAELFRACQSPAESHGNPSMA